MQSFGIPSVRTDVPLPAKPSVANTMNYGNEPSAVQLLAPPKSADLGVKEEHLLALRNRDDIRDLLQKSGVDLLDDEFEAAYEMAAGADDVQGGGQRCCLDTFMKARYYLLQQQMGVL